jgi:hypothetical protein
MTTNQTIDRDGDPSRTALDESSVGDARERLAGLLPDDALHDALKGLEPDDITGPGGLLTQLAGRVIETALGAELTEHLGYPPGQAPPGGVGNHRNGSTPKMLQTELGPVAVRTPRDRQGSFEPRLVGKRQTRLAGLDEKILWALRGRHDGPRHRGAPDRALRRPDRPRHHLAGHRRRARGRRGVAHAAAGRGLPDRLLRRAAREGPRGPLSPLARLLPRAGRDL